MTALDDARADIEREISKHRRHIAEGTSIGGESPEWHETCIEALAAALAIIEESRLPGLEADATELERALTVLRERYGHASIEDAERLTAPPTEHERRDRIRSAVQEMRETDPPTDEEREALDRLSQWVATVTNPLPGLRDHHEDCRAVVAMLRRQGPVTDAQVDAAWRIIEDRDQRFITHDDMRAALEAARSAES